MSAICCSRKLWRSRSVALSMLFLVVSAEEAGIPALVSSLLVSKRESSGVVGKAKVAPGGGAGVAIELHLEPLDRLLFAESRLVFWVVSKLMLSV